MIDWQATPRRRLARFAAALARESRDHPLLAHAVSFLAGGLCGLLAHLLTHG